MLTYCALNLNIYPPKGGGRWLASIHQAMADTDGSALIGFRVNPIDHCSAPQETASNQSWKTVRVVLDGYATHVYVLV